MARKKAAAKKKKKVSRTNPTETKDGKLDYGPYRCPEGWPKTIRQKKFAHNYARTWNKYQSAVDAGFSKSTAKVQGRKLTNLLAPYIQHLTKRNEKRFPINQETVREGLAQLAYVNIADLLDENGFPKPIKDLPRETTAAIKKLKVTKSQNGEITHEFELHDKNKALVDLGKTLGMFDQRLMMLAYHKHEHKKADLSALSSDQLEELQQKTIEYLTKEAGWSEDDLKREGVLIDGEYERH